jgi:hypothetical protein
MDAPDRPSSRIALAADAGAGREPKAKPRSRGALAWRACVLALAVGVGVGLGATRARSSHDAPAGAAVHARPGPWGELTFTRVLLAPPDDVIPASFCRDEQPVWNFPGFDREEVAGMLASAGLPAAERDKLLGTATCTDAPRSCVVHPDQELAAELSPRGREVLYGWLARFRENSSFYFHLRLLAPALDEWLVSSALPAATRDQIRHVVWRTGDTVHLADLPALCHAATPEVRSALVRAYVREPSIVVQLHVAPGQDTTALADWWTTPSRPDVPALLRSLASMPEGGSIDVAHLLPPLARSWVYRFPHAGEPTRDCHWTALNFGASTPDERLLEQKYVREALAKDYRRVPASEARLGDVIVVSDPQDDLLHSAVYLAEDIVLTKNGWGARRPWVLMTLAEVVAEYSYRPGTGYVYYRHL